MSLLEQINESANAQVAADIITDKNLAALLESTGMDVVQLNEAVTQWVTKLRNAITRGKVDPAKREAIVSILGALIALSDEDVADAFDEKGDMGSLLDVIGGADKQMSNAALKRLVQLGRHPSVRTYVQRAREIVEGEPAQAESALKQIQMRLDTVMRRKLHRERGMNGFDPRFKQPGTTHQTI